MNSLKQKTIKGMSWSMIDNIISSGTTFFIGLILARLLTPEEFGLVGIITVFLAIAMLLIDSGFTQALIRKKEVTNIDYSTAFWFNVFVSIICYVLVFVFSDLIANFFEQPELSRMLKVTGVVLLFNSLSIIQRTIFTRLIDFKPIAIITVVSAVVSGVIGLILAYLGFGVWSLVSQIVSRSIVQSILFWLLSNWRPQMTFNNNSFRTMFRFGYKLLFSGLIDVLYRNIFYIVIGKVYSPKLLGEYTRANQFSSIFSSNLLAVIQKVSFPVLSSIQDDDERLRESYRKLIKSSMLITFTLMIGMAAIAKPLILILIGEKWLPAVYLLQILCLTDMFYPLHAINLNILNVKGRSDLFLKLEMYKKSFAIPMVLIGIYFNIILMLWFGVFVACISYYINTIYSAKLINYSVKNQIIDILPSFLVSITVGVLMLSITLFKLNIYLTFTLQFIFGLFLTIIIYEKLKLPEYLEIKEIVIKILRNRLQ